MSSGPARYEVSGERRKPKPSWSTSRVPSPKIASPFFAWCLRRAKTSSCLRSRLAPSSSFVFAMSTSSETCLSLRSERCMPRTCLDVVVSGNGPGRHHGPQKHERSWIQPGREETLRGFFLETVRANSQDGIRLAVSDIAVNEGGELGFRQGPDLGRLEVAVLEEHQGRDAADAVLGRGRLVLVDVELRDLEAPRVLRGDLVERRCDHLAGPAPLRPIVHEDRSLG